MILPKKRDIVDEKSPNFDNDDYICNMINRAVNENIDDCKQSLIKGLESIIKKTCPCRTTYRELLYKAILKELEKK